MKKDRQILGLALIAGGATVAGLAIHGHRTEERKRQDIRAERDAQLTAIRVAKAVVLERLRNGAYSSIDEAMTDFNFEIIAARES